MDLYVLYSQYFANPFLVFYAFALLLLIAFFIIKNKFTPEAKNCLYVLNTLMGYVSVVNLFFLAGELFIAWYGGSSYELYAFSERISGSPVNIYTLILLQQLLGLFFLSKKFRLRTWFVITFLIVLNAGTIYSLVLQFHKDYLPSSWSVYYSETFIQKLSKWVLMPLVLFFTYWFLHKRNKLPHPSLFLKNHVQPD